MANNSAESSRYPSHHPQRDRQPAADYATRSVESVGPPWRARRWSRHSLGAAFVQLGSTLRLQTIAEGIEQAELQDSLLGMGCEIGQGFLFSPPLELSLVRERLVAEGSTGLRVVSSA